MESWKGGSCQDAMRAYCPASCVATKFNVAKWRQAPLGEHTLAAIAAHELALASKLWQLHLAASTVAAPVNRSGAGAAAISGSTQRANLDASADYSAKSVFVGEMLPGWSASCSSPAAFDSAHSSLPPCLTPAEGLVCVCERER